MKSLEEIKKYKHLGVIQRFQKENPELATEAVKYFEDLMIFFWASQKHHLDFKNNPENEDLNFSFIMDEKMLQIDRIWHVFLLFTKDYMDFCEEYFGEYIHHLPDIVPNMPQDESNFEQNLNRFLNYNYDLLGHDVIERWFC